jgi:hypothetical protein
VQLSIKVLRKGGILSELETETYNIKIRIQKLKPRMGRDKKCVQNFCERISWKIEMGR